MQIACHIGPHCTDDDALLKSLLKNKEALVNEGVAVPGPGRYRRIVRETLQSMHRNPLADDARDVMLDAILQEDDVDRLVMSNSNFICVPNRALEDGQFYRQAAIKCARFEELFAADEIEFFIAMRNPATFLPALFDKVAKKTYDQFLSGNDPMAIRWSTVIAQIREACANAQITVWANEDTPLIWGQLIRELSGSDPTTPISGGFDLLAEIMSKPGMRRLRAYLKANPPQTELQKRRIMAAFLDKYAMEDAIEEELDLPGWTDDTVAYMTEQYEDDLFAIERMPGVTMITP